METMNVTTNPAGTVTISREEYNAMKAYIAELKAKLNWLTEQVHLSQVRRVLREFGLGSSETDEPAV